MMSTTKFIRKTITLYEKIKLLDCLKPHNGVVAQVMKKTVYNESIRTIRAKEDEIRLAHATGSEKSPRMNNKVLMKVEWLLNERTRQSDQC